MTVDVCQPEIAAGVAVGEFFVVDAEQVQEGGVDIVDVHLIALGVETVIVSRAVSVAAFHPGAGQRLVASPAEIA